MGLGVLCASVTCMREDAGDDESGTFESQLKLCYTLDMFSNTVPAIPCASSGRSAALPGPEAASVACQPPGSVKDGSRGSRTGIQECLFTWVFSMASVLNRPGPWREKIRVVLLPPPMAVVGTPVALTWVLERVGEQQQTAKEQVPYEFQMVRGWLDHQPSDSAGTSLGVVVFLSVHVLLNSIVPGRKQGIHKTPLP